MLARGFARDLIPGSGVPFSTRTWEMNRMHVYLRDEPVNLRMHEVDAEGLVPDGSDLVPMAFYVRGNDQPSFRALLPPDTVEMLREAIQEPVLLGVLAEEPEDPRSEIHAMVGLAIPVGSDDPMVRQQEDDAEPWRASVGDPEAWRGSDEDDATEGENPRTALLAFAPLVRLQRKFPYDFGEELADLLETALAGATRSAIQARIDRMLDDI
jgi:hypothetical protein